MNTFLEDVRAFPRLFYLYLNIIIALPAFLLAHISNKSFLKEHPKHLGYLWGYFTGYRLFLISLCLVVLLMFFVPDNVKYKEFSSSVFLIVIFYFISGGFILYRNRWAWILYTVFSMNPILWMVNFIYIKNRWKEFGAGKTSSLSNLKVERVEACCPHCGFNYFVDEYRADADVWLCAQCKGILFQKTK